ncbi:MAG: YitT family protein [Succinivibrio sp.]
MAIKELIKRYGVFFFSVVLQGISIATITYADIGTTPISSTNYVLSLHSDFTLGDTTFIFNILLIALQILLIFLGKSPFKDHALSIIMQIPVLFIFSYMIDFGTLIISCMISDDPSYITCWILVITGTLMLATAISLSVVASVAMVPGEYFLKLFHPLVHKSFSYVKTCFDVFLVATAAVLSLFLTDFSAIEGVREGTLYAALATGPTVHLIMPRLEFVKRFFKA